MEFTNLTLVADTCLYAKAMNPKNLIGAFLSVSTYTNLENDTENHLPNVNTALKYQSEGIS